MNRKQVFSWQAKVSFWLVGAEILNVTPRFLKICCTLTGILKAVAIKFVQKRLAIEHCDTQQIILITSLTLAKPTLCSHFSVPVCKLISLV